MGNVSSHLGSVLPIVLSLPPPFLPPSIPTPPLGGGAGKLGKFLPAETWWVPIEVQYVKIRFWGHPRVGVRAGPQNPKKNQVFCSHFSPPPPKKYIWLPILLGGPQEIFITLTILAF